MSSCDSIRTLMNLDLDDELSARGRRELEAHLAGCAGCRNELETLAALLERARELAGPIAPARDLWPGIAARLPTPGRRFGGAFRWRTWPGLVVAAAALVALSVATALLVGHRAVEGEATPGARQASVELAADRAQLELAAAELRRSIEAAMARRRLDLAPETVAAIERNEEIIGRAIAEIRTALEADPGDRRLNLLLAAAYLKEVELLNRLQRAAESS